MAKITWDTPGEHFYETGVKECALYVMKDGAYQKGVAWNGITSISESPSGADVTALYADDAKYLNLVSAEEFGATVEAYTYPDEFAVCDGSAALDQGITLGQQPRSKFGLVYKTTVGNDDAGNAYGYKLHIIYNCLAAPSERSYSTINDSPEAITFSWTLSTTPVTIEKMPNAKPTANITIDSTKIAEGKKAKLTEIENKLYGTTTLEPTLLTPDQIYDIMYGVEEDEDGDGDE